MKTILKKSLVFVLLSVFSLGILPTDSLASFSHDSYGRWTGIGGRADITSITSQVNEPKYYHIRTDVYMNNGDKRAAFKNPAKATDSVTVRFRTSSPVSSGESFHEWIAFGHDRGSRKIMNIN